MSDGIELHKIMEQRLAQTCRLDFAYLYGENLWGADGRLAAPSPSLWEPWSSGTSTVWWYRLCRCRRRPCHSYDQGRRMIPSLWSGPQWGPERETGKKRQRGQRESALTAHIIRSSQSKMFPQVDCIKSHVTGFCLFNGSLAIATDRGI